jgi:hypothetical protein
MKNYKKIELLPGKTNKKHFVKIKKQRDKKK